MITWGAGPAFLLPTATNDLLGAEQWGAGPTGVVLQQNGPWLYGILASHVVARRPAGREAASERDLHPALPDLHVSHGDDAVSTESLYDWTGKQWIVPIQIGVNQLISMDYLHSFVVAALHTGMRRGESRPPRMAARGLPHPYAPDDEEQVG